MLGVGAHALCRRDGDPHQVVTALEQAARNQTVLPTDIAQTLAAAPPQRPGDRADVDPHEREWLRALAAGHTTIARLATRAGYNTREMHRRLRGLYDRLGAHNRADALNRAARWGLLDPEHAHEP